MFYYAKPLHLIFSGTARLLLTITAEEALVRSEPCWHNDGHPLVPAVGDRDKVRLHTVEYESTGSAGEDKDIDKVRSPP